MRFVVEELPGYLDECPFSGVRNGNVGDSCCVFTGVECERFKKPEIPYEDWYKYEELKDCPYMVTYDEMKGAESK